MIDYKILGENHILVYNLMVPELKKIKETVTELCEDCDMEIGKNDVKALTWYWIFLRWAWQKGFKHNKNLELLWPISGKHRLVYWFLNLIVRRKTG